MEATADTSLKPSRAQLIGGVLAWCAFSSIAVALRGVRWDETYEWAQVLLGTVRYPEAHPINRFVWSAYTIQHYATAALLSVVDDVALVNGVRNAFVLAISTSAVFLWASHLTRRVTWGYGATALALFNVLMPFETTYPLRIWPHCFSDGPIGSGWALIALFLVLTQRWRSGFFMVAAMPVIHIGQMPALLATCGLFTLAMWMQGQRAAILRALPFAGLGLAICAGLAVALYVNRIPPPVDGPYYAAGDAWAIWANYKEVWYHTTVRGGLNAFLQSHMAAVMAVLLPLPWAWQAVSARRYSDIWLWLFVFASITSVTVWTAMWIHTRMGVDVPFLIIGWMPYRLSNHLPFLVLCMALGILTARNGGQNVAALLTIASLAVLALRSYLPPVLGEDMYQRYIAGGAWVVFLLVGSATAKLAQGLREDGATPFAWGVLALASFIVLGVLHQWAATVLLAGFIIYHIVSRVVWPTKEGALRVVLAVTAVAIVAIGGDQFVHRGQGIDKGFDVPLDVGEFERAVRGYFESEGIENELVVADNFAPFLQARIGQPVMANWMLGSYIIYTPSFGPPIQKIFHEVYGISFGESVDGRLPQQPEVWRALWASRSEADWRTLGETYNVHYVIAPLDLNLPLEAVVTADGQGLYRLPG